MKSSPGGEISIGDLAGRFGLAASVLRHWEHERLLPPARRVSGRRRYSEEDAYRVAAILMYKAAGLALPEIAAMLEQRSRVRRAMLDRKRIQLQARIEQTEVAMRLIDEARLCRSANFLRCGYFRSIVKEHV